MKVFSFRIARKNTTYLQGLGYVSGTPAGNLKPGDTMVWNNGSTSTVDSIVKETAKTIVVRERYLSSFDQKVCFGERKMNKTRIVARPVNELTETERYAH